MDSRRTLSSAEGGREACDGGSSGSPPGRSRKPWRCSGEEGRAPRREFPEEKRIQIEIMLRL